MDNGNHHGEMNVMFDPWTETFTGKRMYFLTPKEDMVDIKDIAHSLALQCRFNGHVKQFYSVAEHSLLVSEILWHMTKNVHLTFAGLLHDASEAYLGDLPSPVKKCCADYKDLEEGIQKVIHSKFGIELSKEGQEKVKEADIAALKNEALVLLPSKGKDWSSLYQTSFETAFSLQCYSPPEAANRFFSKFSFLEHKRKHLNDNNVVYLKDSQNEPHAA